MIDEAKGVMEQIQDSINRYMHEVKQNPRFVLITSDLVDPLSREFYSSMIFDTDIVSLFSIDDIINSLYSGESKVFGLSIFVLTDRLRKKKSIWVL